MNPYVFIVGCPRSGTTLLQRIVDAHPRLAITPETHWIPRFYRRRTGLTADGRVTPALLDALCEHPTFGKLGLVRADLERLCESQTGLSYAQFVSGIFDLYGAAQGKEFVGDKSPGYAQRVSLLHQLWPTARIVHIIRDGRDVCLSAVGWAKAEKLAGRFVTWREHPILTAALFWEQHVRLGCAAGRSLGSGLYYELRYEALVTDPAGEVRRLCAFLDVAYEEQMLRFHEGRTRREPGLDAKHGWLPITPGLRDWKQQMPADEVERFEAAAGAVLEELGYPRVFHEPSEQASRDAFRVRALFPQHVGRFAQRSGSEE